MAYQNIRHHEAKEIFFETCTNLFDIKVKELFPELHL